MPSPRIPALVGQTYPGPRSHRSKPGVAYVPARASFVVRLRRGTRLVEVGAFPTRDQADACYADARRKGQERPRPAGPDHTALPPGVSYDPARDRYSARCDFPGQRRHLGRFVTLARAVAAIEGARLRSIGQTPPKIPRTSPNPNRSSEPPMPTTIRRPALRLYGLRCPDCAANPDLGLVRHIDDSDLLDGVIGFEDLAIAQARADFLGDEVEVVELVVTVARVVPARQSVAV